MLPIVLFQWFMCAMSSPSTQQPPGNRMNEGFMASSISARSGRRPWSFQVRFGMSDTISRKQVPWPDIAICRRARESDSAAVSSSVEYFQSPLRRATSPFANSFPAEPRTLGFLHLVDQCATAFVGQNPRKRIVLAEEVIDVAAAGEIADQHALAIA